MALSVTSNLTVVDDADAVTNWEQENLSAGWGLNTDEAFEGNGCISGKAKSTGVTRLYYNNGADIDLSSELLRVWARFTELSKYDQVDEGGYCIYVEDSSGNWGEWNVGGLGGVVNEAWNNFIVDTSLSFDRNSGTSPTMTAIRKIGITIRMLTKPARADNLFVDAISYGDGLTVTGTVSTAGNGWAELADIDEANRYGVFYRTKENEYALTGKLIFGDSAGTGSVDFSDSTGSTVAILNNALIAGPTGGVGTFGRPIYPSTLDNKVGIEIVGNGTGTTDFQLGSVVGTGLDRQGIGGGLITSELDRFTFDSETDTSDIDSCNLYGVTFNKAGIIKLDGSTTQDVIGCSFIRCEEVQPNAAEFLNNTIVSPQGRGLELLTTNNCDQIDFIASETQVLPDAVYTYLQDAVHNTPWSNRISTVKAGSAFLPVAAADTVGDFCAYGHTNQFDTIRLSVIAYTSLVVAWEYWNGSTWSSLTVTDNTNSYTTTGQNTITFTPPSDWAQTDIDTTNGTQRERPLYYVRSRVTTTNLATGSIIVLGVENLTECAVHLPTEGTFAMDDFNFYGFAATNNGPNYHIENSAASATVTEETATRDSQNSTNDDTRIEMVQSIQTGGSAATLTRVEIPMRRNANQTTVPAFCVVYDHDTSTNPFGGGSNRPLSDAPNYLTRSVTEVVGADLSDSIWETINYEFTDGYSLSASTVYHVGISQYPGNDPLDGIIYHGTVTSPVLTGNMSRWQNISSAWSSQLGNLKIHVFSGGLATVNATGGNPSTYKNTNATPGVTNIINTVNLNFKVIDAIDLTNIQNARIYLEADTGGPLTAGTTILDPASQLTDVNGELTETFNFTSNQPVIGWVRKGTSSPLYKEAPIVGTITTNGFSYTASMVPDE